MKKVKKKKIGKKVAKSSTILIFPKFVVCFVTLIQAKEALSQTVISKLRSLVFSFLFFYL